jgi:hypothetical protein
MNAEYNWIDIMENHLFDFVADVRREVDHGELIETWFDNGYDDLDGRQKEFWIVLKQMRDTDDTKHYTNTVKGLLKFLEEMYDEDSGVLLSNMESDNEEEEDSDEEDYDDSNDVLPKDCVDGWVADPPDAEPTECPICYEMKSCYSPLDWNTNARCCHKLCDNCVWAITKSDNHNCPQCRRNLCRWLMSGRYAGTI